MHNSGDKSSARGLIHIVEGCADEEENYGEGEEGGKGEEEDCEGGGEVCEDLVVMLILGGRVVGVGKRTYHGIHQSDMFRNRTRENSSHSGEKIADGGDVPESGFFRVEFPVEEIVGQGVGSHSRGEGIYGEEDPELVHDC